METKTKAASQRPSSMAKVFYRKSTLSFFLCRYDVRIYPHLHSAAGACMPDFVRIPFMLYLTKVKNLGWLL